jgi:hypothetical protein
MPAEPLEGLPERRPLRRTLRAAFGLVFVIGVFVVAPVAAMLSAAR